MPRLAAVMKPVWFKNLFFSLLTVVANKESVKWTFRGRSYKTQKILWNFRKIDISVNKLDCLAIRKILKCVTNVLAYECKIPEVNYVGFIGLGPGEWRKIYFYFSWEKVEQCFPDLRPLRFKTLCQNNKYQSPLNFCSRHFYTAISSLADLNDQKMMFSGFRGVVNKEQKWNKLGLSVLLRLFDIKKCLETFFTTNN